MDVTKIHFIGKKENIKPMEKYMKNKFPFIGLKAPERKVQSRLWLKESKELTLEELYQLVTALYTRQEREYQYLAIDLCETNVKRLDWNELKKYSQLIEEKSWWDSVDAWRKVYGLFLKNHQGEREIIFKHFYQHDDFWMRRVAITLQLMEKENTDKELLTQAIIYDKKTDEFFIQKAIGWSLRQYAKVNPNWVIDFVETQELTKFAEQEALKKIKN